MSEIVVNILGNVMMSLKHLRAALALRACESSATRVFHPLDYTLIARKRLLSILQLILIITKHSNRSGRLVY